MVVKIGGEPGRDQCEDADELLTLKKRRRHSKPKWKKRSNSLYEKKQAKREREEMKREKEEKRNLQKKKKTFFPFFNNRQ